VIRRGRGATGPGRRAAATAIAVGLIALALPALAQDVPETPASAAPEEAPARTYIVTSEPAPPPEAASEASTLRCRDVLCLCAGEPRLASGGMVFEPLAARGCGAVVCSCTAPTTPGASARPEPAQPAAQEALLPPPEPAPPRPEPVPETGFLLGRGRLGLSVAAGWPFVELQVAYGAHEAVEVAAGYRAMYGLASAWYGGLRLRLHENRKRGAALSLLALGGYTYVVSGEGHNRSTQFAGGDSGFGEAALALSVGRNIAWFTFLGGARVSGVQDHICSSAAVSSTTLNCEQAVFPDGEAGVLVTVMLEVGFAVRLNSFMSLLGAVGGDWFVNSEAREAFVRGRLGFSFDLETVRRRR
jgi:hypothetical protein